MNQHNFVAKEIQLIVLDNMIEFQQAKNRGAYHISTYQNIRQQNWMEVFIKTGKGTRKPNVKSYLIILLKV